MGVVLWIKCVGVITTEIETFCFVFTPFHLIGLFHCICSLYLQIPSRSCSISSCIFSSSASYHMCIIFRWLWKRSFEWPPSFLLCVWCRFWKRKCKYLLLICIIEGMNLNYASSGCFIPVFFTFFIIFNQNLPHWQNIITRDSFFRLRKSPISWDEANAVSKNSPSLPMAALSPFSGMMDTLYWWIPNLDNGLEIWKWMEVWGLLHLLRTVSILWGVEVMGMSIGEECIIFRI